MINGLRGGIEYYGSKMYQPGDSLRAIDWKHSVKYDKLISKEFVESSAQPSIILINLIAHSDEEADKLAQKIMVVALTLASEHIPAAIATYNDEELRSVAPIFREHQLVAQSLKIIKEIEIKPPHQSFLPAPSILRLKANISNLQTLNDETAAILSNLLTIEYQNIKRNAENSIVFQTITKSLSEVSQQASLVIISQLNHDAEAIAYTSYHLARRGTAVITV